MIGLTLLLALGGGLAQEPRDTVRLTLDEAVRRAVESGEEIRLARAQVREARGQVREAFATALPQVTGAVVYTRQFASIFQDFAGPDTGGLGDLFKNSPFGAPNAWRVDLTASQLLYSGGKVGAGLRAAREYRRAAEAQSDETAADLAFRVKRAYFDAAYAGRIMEVALASLTQAREQLRQVQLYQRAGTRAEYDLLRARVDAANQEPVVVAAVNAYDLAVLELRRLVNVPADQPLVLVTPLVAEDEMVPVAELDSVAPPPTALDDRPAVAAAEASVVVWEQALRIARADRLPTLTVSSTLSEQAFPARVSPFGEQFRRNWNAELKLSFPIFLGFRTVGAVERARASLERARAERDQVREQVTLEVAQARAELARTLVLLAARRETVRQAEQALHLSSVRYANGITTQLEVSDARLLRQQAQANEAQAMRDYLVSLAQLERALGRPVPVVRRPVSEIAAKLNPEDVQP